MSAEKPTRRDLLKPVQLLGLAFIAALFAGVVTLITTGFFQSQNAQQMQHIAVVAAVDRPVLLPDETDAAASEEHDGDQGSRPTA